MGAGGEVYTPDTTEIDLSMGSLPALVVHKSERARGNHPLNSFAAIGPLARLLIMHQSPLDVYAPLQALTEQGGAILLMGVGLERMTFLHYAEQEAGRIPFRRWANGLDDRPAMVAVGSCSEGFDHFAPVLAALNQQFLVGESIWQAFPAYKTLRLAVEAIRRKPFMTRCDDSDCERCADAIQGGPLLAPSL
jgi:aminoglycoside 3-N-acetyltransferase